MIGTRTESFLGIQRDERDKGSKQLNLLLGYIFHEEIYDLMKIVHSYQGVIPFKHLTNILPVLDVYVPCSNTASKRHGGSLCRKY